MTKTNSIRAMICGLALFAATAVPAQSVPSDNEIFSFGRKAAYAHSMDLLGIARGHTAPAGTTMGLFYTQSPEYRAPYISGAVFGFAHIASILGDRRSFECFQSLAPHSAKALDAVWSSGSLQGRSGMISTLRSFCVSQSDMEAMGQR